MYRTKPAYDMSTSVNKSLNYSEDYNEDELPFTRDDKRWSFSEESSETAAKLREEKKRGLLIKMDSLKKLKTDRDRKASFSSNLSLSPEDINGIGPLTLEDMTKAMNNVHEEKVVTYDNRKKVYVYIESAATGRFYKYAMSIDGEAIDGKEEEDIVDYDFCLLFPKRETRERAISKLELVMKMASTFLNGLVAGYSVAVLYEVFINDQPTDFAIHYANRANEVRRFYFIADTVCFSMTLFQYELKKRGMNKNMISNFIDVRFLCSLLCYLISLVLSLFASFIENDLFQLEKQHSNAEKIDGENWYTTAKYLEQKDLDTRINRLQVLCIFRSVLCIISWIVYCRDALDEYSRLQRANIMMKKIEGLSEK